GGMALQVELIPTGEIIRVVYPHRPSKLSQSVQHSISANADPGQGQFQFQFQD
ncbi:hypothetical protein J0S82_019941, partial [Galemys pyrenaicus]